MNLDDITDEVTPDERTVQLCTRGDLTTRIEHLQREISKARTDSDTLGLPETVRELATEIEALTTQAQDFTHGFTVAGVSSTKWRTMLAENPPSREQRSQGLDHDPDKFPVAAVAASLVKIDGEEVTQTIAQVERFADKLSAGQWIRLWNTVLDVNVRAGGEVPKSAVATAILRHSEPNSTTAPPEESPTPSS